MTTNQSIAQTVDGRGGRKGAVVAMIAAPLLIVVAEMLTPVNDATDTTSERVTHIIDHADRYSVAVTCLMLAMLLFVPAILGLRRFLLDDRRPGSSGTVLASTGFMLFAAASGALGVGPTAWAEAGVDQSTLVKLFDAMNSGKGAMPIVQWGPILALVGLVTLAVALWRHTSHPRWAAVALPVGWAAFLFTPAHPTRAGGALLMLAAFMPTILRSRPRVAVDHNASLSRRRRPTRSQS